MSAHKLVATDVETARSINPARVQVRAFGKKNLSAAKREKEKEAETQDWPRNIDKSWLQSVESKAPFEHVIAHHVGIPASSLVERFEQSLEDLGLDSIGAVQLADQLFARFHLEIHPDELFKASPSHLTSWLPATTASFTGSTSSASEASATTKDGNRTSKPLEQVDAALHDNATSRSFASSPSPSSYSSGPSSISSFSPWSSHHPDPNSASAAAGETTKTGRGDIERKFLPHDELSRDPVAAPKSSARTNTNTLGKAFGTQSPQPTPFTDPLRILAQSNAVYEDAARDCGFANYWGVAGPLQSDIVIAFFIEALQNLGVDLSEFAHGVDIPLLPNILPKYGRLMKRLWDVLESRYIILQRGGKILRGSDRVSTESSLSLCKKLRTEHPVYECEADLLELVGPVLADCLTGKVDPIKVLFGSAKSRDMMQTFYRKSPMMSSHMRQLNYFFAQLVQTGTGKGASVSTKCKTFRILEIGGGTGGTTSGLLVTLEKSGVPFHYTFTDVGPSFVSKAKLRWGSHGSMDFAVYDVEKDTPQQFTGQYDVVLGANVVHATSDRTATCRRLKETLRPGGILVLSEITHPIDWYDICFGLLDGWWLADKGKGYAVQPASVWMEVFNRAGFQATGHSGGSTEESNTQQLLMGVNK